MIAIDVVRQILEQYTFIPSNEAKLQTQLVKVLSEWPDVRVLGREVIAKGGRYDVLIEVGEPHPSELKHRVVLELKMRGTAAAVERQAQRYAITGDLDAVMIVTTSSKLARKLSARPDDHLGGKPFGVVYLRPF